MTKDELVKRVAEHLNEDQGEALRFVDSTLHQIAHGLAEVESGYSRVTLGDFGIFSTRFEGPHVTHVPGKDEPVEVPAQVRVLFHPAPSLRAQINAAEQG